MVAFHFTFIQFSLRQRNFVKRPCPRVKFLSITVYGHLTASVLWGKGSASHQLIVWHCLISVLFLAVIAIHCEHSVLLDIVSIQLSYFTRMGLLVKCGLAALRRHLALPPYESSIRVLKVREFVNSIFPSKFSTDRLFYSTNHRRGPSIMRSRDLFWPISDLTVAVTSFYYSRLEAIGR